MPLYFSGSGGSENPSYPSILRQGLNQQSFPHAKGNPVGGENLNSAVVHSSGRLTFDDSHRSASADGLKAKATQSRQATLPKGTGLESTQSPVEPNFPLRTGSVARPQSFVTAMKQYEKVTVVGPSTNGYGDQRSVGRTAQIPNSPGGDSQRSEPPILSPDGISV